MSTATVQDLRLQSDRQRRDRLNARLESLVAHSNHVAEIFNRPDVARGRAGYKVRKQCRKRFYRARRARAHVLSLF